MIYLIDKQLGIQLIYDSYLYLEEHRSVIEKLEK
jgi:hypothetical protein